MSLNISNEFPYIHCRNCFYWSPNPLRNQCKRFIYPNVLIPAKPTFSSDQCGEFHRICADFVPAERCVELCKIWPGFSAYFEAVKDEYEWLKYVTVIINGDESTRYKISRQRFACGTMIDENGLLHYEKAFRKAIKRKNENGNTYYVVSRVDNPGTIAVHASTLYVDSGVNK